MAQPLSYPVDTKDRRLVEILIDNARTPLEDIADELQISVEDVDQRINKLEEIGIIKVYRAVVDPYLYSMYFYENGPMGMKEWSRSRRAKR
ncbi:MAG: hypothetical protein C7B46_00430 [Sulfobacillus benefaciens]|jgi:DNA-binding Lrp family transcriptional regulator|uniref:HTH asnC-type domain-containing protein n=1 Tax=Sulfobacillus benefaciens TaxID=453960 RepID=A0A2T2XLW6_9FIRM|nr:MAG: hypothetical protein C7B46_00430 [Sulfobacillus benefaciens]